MSFGSMITSIQGVIDVFNDPDATGWEKISSIITLIIGILPLATTLFQTFGTTAAASGAAAATGLKAVVAGLNAALGPIGWIILA